MEQLRGGLAFQCCRFQLGINLALAAGMLSWKSIKFSIQFSSFCGCLLEVHEVGVSAQGPAKEAKAKPGTR
jgi:hypothetical protein